MDKNFKEKKSNLKLIRNKFLRLHKILLDNDRQNYEREFGAISSGKFLELLLSDEKFSWLRIISTLIVRIDETFDLKDGINNEMLDGFYTESRDLFDEMSDEYREFKDKLKVAIVQIPEAKQIKNEIIELLESK